MTVEKRTMILKSSEFKTRENENNEAPRIEGYFVVFGDTYDMGYGMTESVDAHAFDDALNGDIRCLIDHDTAKVLGRTKAGTLELRVDNYGLFGSVEVNPNDQDAMNLYARVKRGDVDQCSFGFNILDETTEFRENGDIHWTINKVELFEVSVCTFPAYEATEVSARSKEKEQIKKRSFEAWHAKTLDSHPWLRKEEE